MQSPASVMQGAASSPGPEAHANLYMAIGDSITAGDGSSDGRGYLPYLAQELDAYWLGRATIVNEGVGARRSVQGEAMMGPALGRHHPAYALILFGTNDFNDASCRRSPGDCYTMSALRSMIAQAREVGTYPVVATLPPVNPLWVDGNADERNEWVRQMNLLVRAMVSQEQVSLADIHAEFDAQPDLPALFADEKHPNDLGHELITRAFFEAITRRGGPAGAAWRRRR